MLTCEDHDISYWPDDGCRLCEANATIARLTAALEQEQIKRASWEHAAKHLEAERNALTAALAEAEARTAELVAAAYEAAVEAIEALPRRQEPIGGQMVSYVQIAEAITAIRALAKKEAKP